MYLDFYKTIFRCVQQQIYLKFNGNEKVLVQIQASAQMPTWCNGSIKKRNKRI